MFCNVNVCFQKTDSLSKLYEMDESPDRRAWLDKLLAYMEDRRTPITTCPTISKNPLDLFRLYMYVKDRGGFMEVRTLEFHALTNFTDLNLPFRSQKTRRGRTSPACWE